MFYDFEMKYMYWKIDNSKIFLNVVYSDYRVQFYMYFVGDFDFDFVQNLVDDSVRFFFVF